MEMYKQAAQVQAHTSMTAPRKVTAYEHAFRCNKTNSGNVSASVYVPRKCIKMQKIQAWLHEGSHAKMYKQVAQVPSACKRGSFKRFSNCIQKCIWLQPFTTSTEIRAKLENKSAVLCCFAF
jgi:hypothetical protein